MNGGRSIDQADLCLAVFFLCFGNGGVNAAAQTGRNILDGLDAFFRCFEIDVDTRNRLKPLTIDMSLQPAFAKVLAADVDGWEWHH